MNNNKLNIALFIGVLLVMISCQKNPSTYEKIEPAHTEHIEGSDISKLTLTQKAVERTNIKTDVVKINEAAEGGIIVPYAALLYDKNGGTWVYTNPENLVYIREAITVDRIKGNDVFVTVGPPVGTVVVTSGAAELLGTEYHVGH